MTFSIKTQQDNRNRTLTTYYQEFFCKKTDNEKIYGAYLLTSLVSHDALTVI
jgi:hypothetical protein